jgi:hypothetical protein
LPPVLFDVLVAGLLVQFLPVNLFFPFPFFKCGSGCRAIFGIFLLLFHAVL